MIVEEIGTQAVAHDSGGIVASTARQSFVYARGGRSVNFDVEPLETYYVRVPAAPTWDDGSPLTEAELRQAVDDLAATFQHWGQPVEFVYPQDPRILHSLDDLVGHIRANRPGAR